MTSPYIWIGIIVGVFFVGIGISYTHFQANNPSNFMTMTPQQMLQMMDDPQTMQQMMNDPQFQQRMMQQMNQWMLDDPITMQEMIMSTMQESDQIQMMEDMMEDLMQRMQNDPELEQAMM